MPGDDCPIGVRPDPSCFVPAVMLRLTCTHGLTSCACGGSVGRVQPSFPHALHRQVDQLAGNERAAVPNVPARVAVQEQLKLSWPRAAAPRQLRGSLQAIAPRGAHSRAAARCVDSFFVVNTGSMVRALLCSRTA
jgi:hypothetical protein